MQSKIDLTSDLDMIKKLKYLRNLWSYFKNILRWIEIEVVINGILEKSTEDSLKILGGFSLEISWIICRRKISKNMYMDVLSFHPRFSFQKFIISNNNILKDICNHYFTGTWIFSKILKKFNGVLFSTSVSFTEFLPSYFQKFPKELLK